MELYERILTKEEINKRFHTAVNAILMNHLISSKTGLAESLGMTPSKLSEILNGRMNASAETLARMCDFYEISPEWLFLSRGNKVFRTTAKPKIWIDDEDLILQYSDLNNEVKTETDKSHVAAQPNTPTARDRLPEAFRCLDPQHSTHELIPLVSQKVVAGFGNADFAITESDVKEYYVIPKWRRQHVDFMIEVTGDSMQPKYNAGDIVGCTIIHNSGFIQWNRPHVIATREQGLLIKRLMPGSTTNSLSAVSENTQYPPFDIPKEEIAGIALVIGHVNLE